MKMQLIGKYRHVTGGADNEINLVELEAERVRSKEVRELLLRCEIKNLNPMIEEIKSFKQLLENFYAKNMWKINKLYIELLEYGA